MKTLHLYLTRQVLQTLAMTVLVCTLVLLLGNSLREVLPLLVSGQATFADVGRALLLLIPYLLVYSLPMGLLAATLLVFGRFSADQEYTAVRAGGISLMALITPVLILSGGLCGLSALINMQIGPQCRVQFKELRSRIYTAQPLAFLAENRFITECDNFVIYIGKRDGEHLENVLVNVMETNELVLSVRAPEGTVTEDKEKQQIILKLLRAQAISRERSTAPPDTNAVPDGVVRETAPKRDLMPTFGDFTIPIDLKGVASDRSKPGISELTMAELVVEKEGLKKIPMDEGDRKRLVSVVDVEIHRQISFSFACLGFTLVGIPLGIRAHRRETMAGMFIAIALVLVYHGFVNAGQAMNTKPERYPHLIVWIPTFLFQIVGATMLWRANRRVA